MARELTSTQQANVEAGATRPIYLVEWKHSGVTEYLSCSGDVTYDGQAYTAGGLTITSIEDSKVATIVLPATAARITQIQNNKWRLGICKITAILAAPGDTPTYTAADGLLVLDGVIETSAFSGEVITVVAKCKYYNGALVPRFTFNEVITSIPAVGSTSTWEGEVYSYEQWLKTTAAIQRLTRPGVNPQVTGRQSTSTVNSFTPVEQTGQKLLTAQGVHIPIVYGRASVPGYIFADGLNGSSKFIGVAWCMGQINAIEAVYINDEPVPATVTAKHYLGTTTQTVSPALQLYTALSPEFSDDLILRLPAGNIGIAYSVFNIPTSAISGAPRFRAIIQGRLVNDPSSSSTDPYADSVEWSFDFLTGTTDSGPNAYTLTLNGDAGIASPSIGLELDGTGDYATIPDGTAIGSNPFSLELEVQCDTAVTSPGTVETLICQGSTTSPLSRSIQIDRVGDEVLLYLSSDGSTWDICDGLSCGTLATTGSPEVTGRILVERVDNQISTYMDGATQTGVVTTAAIFDSGAVWEIGACGASQELDGRVRSARLTIGNYRYGSPHAITNTPFSDSGNYTAGTVYSENPILCAADLASNPLFGLNATTAGVTEAAAYCDTTLDSGAPRCRLGIAIQDVRLVESWLDVLVTTYGNGLWFPEGSDIKFIADKKKDGTNGSGRELYTATSPEFGSPLPTVTTEDGVSYSISVEITAISTTSPLTGVSVWFGGVQVITSVTALGVHGATVTASGTSNTIEVIEDASFDGTWANLSVKRTHRAVTQWLPSTLQVTGLPEGDKPNAVTVSYTVPDETSGAWAEKSFGVQNAAVTAGDPIVLTNLSLPGVYRIEEASNKAIAKLYREDSKVRISLISTDEEFVAQPGDTVQVVNSYRGIDTPVWVESNKMISYGRHQIAGTIYRDNQYPDTDYTDGGTFVGGGYVEEEIGVGTPFCIYSCSAIDTAIAQQATGETLGVVDTWHSGSLATFDWPFSEVGGDVTTKWTVYSSYIASPTIQPDWSGSGAGNGFRTGDLAAWAYDENLGFCDTPNYAMNAQYAGTVEAIAPPTDIIESGDYTFNIIITGYNGGSTLSHELVRNPGANWNFTTTTSSNDFPSATVWVTSNGAGGHQINLTAGNTPGNASTVIDIGVVAGQWILVSGKFENSYIIDVDGALLMYVTITVMVTTSDGSTYTDDVTGYKRIYAGSSYPAHSVSLTSHTFYTRPRYLYQSSSANISVAKITYNTGSNADLTALSRAFQSNFASFTGGDWCGI